MLNDSLDHYQIESRFIEENEDNEEFSDTETKPSISFDDSSLNISAESSMMNQSFQNQSFQQSEQTYYAVQFIDRNKIDREGNKGKLLFR